MPAAARRRAARDEVARLADSFDVMLGELERSLTVQRRLVVDASHELRTPLTALRTNAELLARADRLSDTQRDRAAGALRRQTDEVTGLVNDLIELARDEEPHPLLEEGSGRGSRGTAPEGRFAFRPGACALLGIALVALVALFPLVALPWRCTAR